METAAAEFIWPSDFFGMLPAEEKALRILAGFVYELLCIFAADFSGAACRAGNKRRVVSLPAEWHWRHIWTVCFKQYAVLRHHFGNFNGDARIFECDGAAQTYIHTYSKDFLCHFDTSGKAVDNAV